MSLMLDLKPNPPSFEHKTNNYYFTLIFLFNIYYSVYFDMHQNMLFELRVSFSFSTTQLCRSGHRGTKAEQPCSSECLWWLRESISRTTVRIYPGVSILASTSLFRGKHQLLKYKMGWLSCIADFLKIQLVFYYDNLETHNLKTQIKD